jgi:hypothetical protein
MDGLVVTIILGALAYLVCSLRGIIKSTRRFVEVSTAEAR